VSQTLNAVRMVEFRPGYERFIGNICAKKNVQCYPKMGSLEQFEISF